MYKHYDLIPVTLIRHSIRLKVQLLMIHSKTIWKFLSKCHKELKTPGMLSQNLHSTWHAQALSSIHVQHLRMTAWNLPGAHHHKQGKGGCQGCAANPAQIQPCSETKICLDVNMGWGWRRNKYFNNGYQNNAPQNLSVTLKRISVALGNACAPEHTGNHTSNRSTMLLESVQLHWTQYSYLPSMKRKSNS